MKRYVALFMAILMVFSLAACGAGETEQTISGTLPEIIDKIYETADLDEDQRQLIKDGVETMEIPRENMAYFFGIDVDCEEAVASEPMINAIPFSICLMRVKEDTDIEALKKEIKENVNPRKWVCVEVDQSDVRVESVGDLVLLIMADDSEKYSEAFHALAE